MAGVNTEPYVLTADDRAVFSRHLREVFANRPPHCTTLAEAIDEAVFRSVYQRLDSQIQAGKCEVPSGE